MTNKEELHYICMEIIRLLISSPYSAPLKELELEAVLLGRLHKSIGSIDTMLQASLLETITVALKLQLSQAPQVSSSYFPYIMFLSSGFRVGNLPQALVRDVGFHILSTFPYSLSPHLTPVPLA